MGNQKRLRVTVVRKKDGNGIANCKPKCPKILAPFCLRHPKMDDFTTSPCFSNPYVLCAFRATAAAYLISWWLFNLSAYMENGKMFIYFTNVCFTFISFYFVYGFNLSCISIKQRRDELYRVDGRPSETRPLAPASNNEKKLVRVSKMEENDVTISEIITSEDESMGRPSGSLSPTIETRHDLFWNLSRAESIIEENEEQIGTNQQFSEIPETSSNLSVCYQIYWLLFYISSNTSILLIVGYWYNILDDTTSYYNSLTKHVIAMAFVAMEFFLSRTPVYITHMIYPVAFGALYYIFTLIYWSSGGTDLNGRAYLYDVMNYSQGSLTRLMIPPMTIFLVQPMIHFGFYVLGIVRRWLDGKLCRKTKSFK